MNILSSANAFNSGSDLWILPDSSASRWTTKVDWYLNFQIVRSSRHPRPELPSFVTFIQNETELEVFTQPATHHLPLMISSERFFPNKWVVVVPSNKNFSFWVRQSSNIWENLKHPTLRIYLPTGQSASSFHDEWQSLHTFEDFTLVLD